MILSTTELDKDNDKVNIDERTAQMLAEEGLYLAPNPLDPAFQASVKDIQIFTMDHLKWA